MRPRLLSTGFQLFNSGAGVEKWIGLEMLEHKKYLLSSQGTHWRIYIIGNALLQELFNVTLSRPNNNLIWRATMLYCRELSVYFYISSTDPPKPKVPTHDTSRTTYKPMKGTTLPQCWYSTQEPYQKLLTIYN
jgi:hypothetical protein